MCVLRVNGVTFDPRAYLRTSTMTACAGHLRGQPRRRTKPDGDRHADSGFVVRVSEASWSNLAEQARDAVTFIVTHEAELAALAVMPDVDDVRLDFPVYRRDVFVQCELFPRDLVRLAGRVGLALELSLYPEADDGDDDAAADDASVPG